MYISAVDGAAAEQCRDIIEAMTAEVKVGKIYTGRSSASRTSARSSRSPRRPTACATCRSCRDKYVDRVDDVVNMGDEIKVKVILIDDQGRIKLSPQGGDEGARRDRPRAGRRPRRRRRRR